jgi:glycosyltransferase involved in cell wall biosynthesis
MKANRILFIYSPRYPDSMFLDTMPFAVNAVRLLAENGTKLTVCLWEERKAAYDFLETYENVRVLYLKYRFLTTLARLHPICAAQLGVRLRSRFDYVFAVGQRGLIVATSLRRIFGGQLIYFSDEYPSNFGAGRWERLERASAQHTDLIVVPDECRIGPLLEELDLPEDHNAVALPNIPFWDASPLHSNWHSAFGVPSQLNLILYAGTIEDWAQIPELLFTVRAWPADTALLLQSRFGQQARDYQRSLRHLHEEGRIFWGNRLLSQAELNSLTAAAKCTIALYRDHGPNNRDLGMSSGKIMRSIVNGTPVLASRYGGLEFIEKNGLGMLISSPHEIPDGIKYILQNHEQMRRNCLRFRDSELDFRKYWDRLWEKLEQPLQNPRPVRLPKLHGLRRT